MFVERFNHKLYIQVVVSNHRWSQMPHSPKIVRQHSRFYTSAILHTCWLAKFSSSLWFLHLGGRGSRCHARSQQGTLRHITHRPSIAKRASLLRFLQGWSPKAWNVVALVGQTSMLFKMHEGHTFSYIRDTTTNIIVLSSGGASETYQEIFIWNRPCSTISTLQRLFMFRLTWSWQQCTSTCFDGRGVSPRILICYVLEFPEIPEIATTDKCDVSNVMFRQALQKTSRVIITESAPKLKNLKVYYPT